MRLAVLFCALVVAWWHSPAASTQPIDDEWRSYAGDSLPDELASPPIYRENWLRRPGDANNDGDVDFDDIDPFVVALTAQTDNWQRCHYMRFLGCNPLNIDMNFDGTLNHHDIEPFIIRLVDPSRYFAIYRTRIEGYVGSWVDDGLIGEPEATAYLNDLAQ